MANQAQVASYFVRSSSKTVLEYLQSGPCSTYSFRHMSEVENEKTVVIRLIARNANTRSASARRDIGVVNSYIRSPILHADETAILRRSLV